MKEDSVFTIAGAKGGVGKTTTSINLGTVAAVSGRTTLLVEADIAMANIVDFLDLPFDPKSDPTLHDVLAGDLSASEATVRADSGLEVLPSGDSLDGFARSDSDRLASVIQTAGTEYDLVIVDTAAGVSRKTLIPMAAADATVLVTTPRVSAVRDTQKTLELVRRVGGECVGVIVNEAGTGNAPPPERLAKFLNVPLLGSVPIDERIARAQDRGQAIVEFDPSSPAARGFLETAEALGFTAKSMAGGPTAHASGSE